VVAPVLRGDAEVRLPTTAVDGARRGSGGSARGGSGARARRGGTGVTVETTA